VVDLGKNAEFSDVIDSLSSMGYDKKLVEQKVLQLVEVLKGDKDFASKSQKEKEDILFRRAIVELA
jgi:Holliday junction DNA helicase RuvA